MGFFNDRRESVYVPSWTRGRLIPEDGRGAPLWCDHDFFLAGVRPIFDFCRGAPENSEAQICDVYQAVRLREPLSVKGVWVIPPALDIGQHTEPGPPRRRKFDAYQENRDLKQWSTAQEKRLPAGALILRHVFRGAALAGLAPGEEPRLFERVRLQVEQRLNAEGRGSGQFYALTPREQAFQELSRVEVFRSRGGRVFALRDAFVSVHASAAFQEEAVQTAFADRRQAEAHACDVRRMESAGMIHHESAILALAGLNRL